MLFSDIRCQHFRGIKGVEIVYYESDIAVKHSSFDDRQKIHVNGVTFNAGLHNLNIQITSYDAILSITSASCDINYEFNLVKDIPVSAQFSIDKCGSYDIGIRISSQIQRGSPINYYVKHFSLSENDNYVTKTKTINSMIDKVYLINLDARPDRLFRASRYLNNLHIDYERIAGKIPKINEFAGITSVGALGCLQSHICVLHDAVKHDYDAILILEDDFVPHKRFLERQDEIFNLLQSDADIIYLGCSQHNFGTHEFISHDGYYEAKKSRGTFAYIVKKHMFSVLLRQFEKYDMNADVSMEYIQEMHKCYVIYENLMIADLNDSNISTRRDIYKYATKFGWNNQNYYNDISVIVPVYNGSDYLLECLNSIKNQEISNFELIIVNDASSDSTDAIIRNFSQRNPDVAISYVEHNANKGLPNALNTGLLNSHGKYVTWIAHDNIFRKNALRIMYDRLCKSNKYLVIGGHTCIDDMGYIISHVRGHSYDADTIVKQFHGAVSFMFRREVMDAIGLYDVDLFGVEDHDYLIRILELFPHSNEVVNESLCDFRIHEGQLTNKIKHKYPNLKTIMLDKMNKRRRNDKINILDTLIYPPTIKFDILFQRPQQLMSHLSNSYNCIFAVKNRGVNTVKYGIRIISWDTLINSKERYVRNKIIVYYTDPRTHKYIEILNPDYIIFDLIDNPCGEFECWKENLHLSITTADIVTYSAKYLRKLINVDEHVCVAYLTNACAKDLFPSQKQPIKYPYDKIIIGYCGAISSWLDPEILNVIANDSAYHIIMVGCISDDPNYNKKFYHPNITWIEHVDYSEIPAYIESFDVCIIPFLNTEMIKGCNPIKLYEYIASGKPIISTILFEDFQYGYHVINKNNVIEILNNIFRDDRPKCHPPYWDDVAKILDNKIIELKRKKNTQRAGIQRCAYVTNMLVDWETLQPRYGGGERYALSIADLLKKFNIETHFFQLANHACKTTYYGHVVHCINKTNLANHQEFATDFSRIVNDIITADKYDCVIYGMPEMCCSDNIINNSISINHGIWFDRNTIDKNEKWFSLMKKHVERPCINVSVDTNFMNFMRIFYPEYSEKINYIPNFYDNKTYFPMEKHNDVLTIVIPRRANIYRGSRLMGDVLKYLNINIKIIWVGYGDVEDNTILRELESNDARFEFTGCSFDEMIKFYNIADIVLIPTIASEGTSLSCIEAMACGCAVISTNVGGLCNLIIDGFNGILVNPTAHDIADAIMKLARDDELRNALITNAILSVKQYTKSEWERKWIGIMHKMGWVYKDAIVNDLHKSVDILDNRAFDKYWKNYVHQNELHGKLSNKDGAQEYMKSHSLPTEINIIDENIKICILTRHAINGGVESIIYEEAKYLNADIYVTNGIIDKLNPFIFGIVKNVSEILNVVKNYDIIIYHWLPEYALYAIKLSGIPAIEYLHRRDTDDNDKTIPVNIITHSPFLINHCFEKYKKSSILLEHPINTSKFQPGKNANKYIGCFCTYNPIKGIDLLLRAFALVKDAIGEELWGKYTYVFFGKDQNNEKDNLIHLAKYLDLKCEFRDSVYTWEHINSFELIIIPSRLEGLPVALLEALACDIPVIISDLEGVRDFYNIARGRGYDNLFEMFESENVTDLAQKIYEWFKHPYMCENGHKYINEFYSSLRHSNKLMSIVKKHYKTCGNIKKDISITEISNYGIMHVSNELCPYVGQYICYDNFIRIYINDNITTFKRIEILFNALDVHVNVPVGYQFDIVEKDGTKYDSGTMVISNGGLKSICSAELNMTNCVEFRINIRPNKEKFRVKDIQIIGYS